MTNPFDAIGLKITGPILPTDPTDPYPTHLDEYGYGGWRSVETLAQRDAIPAVLRKSGMAVYVREMLQAYILGPGLANSDWTFLDRWQMGLPAVTHLSLDEGLYFDAASTTTFGSDWWCSWYGRLPRDYPVDGTNRTYSVLKIGRTHVFFDIAGELGQPPTLLIVVTDLGASKSGNFALPPTLDAAADSLLVEIASGAVTVRYNNAVLPLHSGVATGFTSDSDDETYPPVKCIVGHPGADALATNSMALLNGTTCRVMFGNGVLADADRPAVLLGKVAPGSAGSIWLPRLVDGHLLLAEPNRILRPLAELDATDNSHFRFQGTPEALPVVAPGMATLSQPAASGAYLTGTLAVGLTTDQNGYVIHGLWTMPDGASGDWLPVAAPPTLSGTTSPEGAVIGQNGGQIYVQTNAGGTAVVKYWTFVGTRGSNTGWITTA